MTVTLNGRLNPGRPEELPPPDSLLAAVVAGAAVPAVVTLPEDDFELDEQPAATNAAIPTTMNSVRNRGRARIRSVWLFIVGLTPRLAGAGAAQPRKLRSGNLATTMRDAQGSAIFGFQVLTWHYLAELTMASTGWWIVGFGSPCGAAPGADRVVANPRFH